ncbi:MAG: hypothetical protein WKF58_00580 [Ilumatobacteraceae bacterium]
MFNDAAALADLNGIVHPPLGEEISGVASMSSERPITSSCSTSRC